MNPPRVPLPLLFLCLLCTCVLAHCATPERLAEKEVATYILVRHAEKGYGSDPDLTEAGQRRAESLRELLKNEEIDLVYSTDTRRTMQTAAPTAEAQGLPVYKYNARELADFTRLLRSKGRGKTTLVVGHSNSTPSLANLLAGREELARFSELDYTNLIVVTLPPAGRPRILQLRY